LNVVAQIILASKVLPVARQLSHKRLVGLTRLQLILAWFPFALGALNLILKATLENSDAAENRIEWIFAMQMQLYFLVTYFSWRETQFRLSFVVGKT
jgi:predicted acyltransferase